MNLTCHKWVIILLEHDRTWLKCLTKEFHEYRMVVKHWVWSLFILGLHQAANHFIIWAIFRITH